MDLTTNYLGLALRNPLVASASPLSRNVDGVRRLADVSPDGGGGGTSGTSGGGSDGGLSNAGASGTAAGRAPATTSPGCGMALPANVKLGQWTDMADPGNGNPPPIKAGSR